MHNPRDYFERLVKPANDDWRDQMLAEHRARALAMFLDNMADVVFVHCNPKSQYNKQTYRDAKKKYRDDLQKQTPEYGIIRDVADSTIHVHLDRKPRDLTSINQTLLKKYADFDDVEEFDALDDVDKTALWGVVKNDGGTCRLREVVDVTLDMWEQELKTRGL